MFGKLLIWMETTANLTNRETEIAERIAWGSSQKEVANDLGISRHTVDNILRKIYQKLKIGKINELSAWWFCSHFNISFDLSPLQRTCVTMSLLAIFIYGEFNNVECYRSRNGRGRTRTEIVRLKRLE